MKNKIYRAANKALLLTLMAAILATGCLAVRLTHIHASITVTFGDSGANQVASADTITLAQLEPLPLRKPRGIK
jgi:hypothetical protein